MDKDYLEAVDHLTAAADRIRLAKQHLKQSEQPVLSAFLESLERLAGYVESARDAIK